MSRRVRSAAARERAKARVERVVFDRGAIFPWSVKPGRAAREGDSSSTRSDARTRVIGAGDACQQRDREEGEFTEKLVNINRVQRW